MLSSNTTQEEGRPVGSDGEQKAESDDREDIMQLKRKDPLRWFGMLTPPALKAAQASFTNAVEKSIPRLIHIKRELEAAEEQIREARRKARNDEGRLHS